MQQEKVQISRDTEISEILQENKKGFRRSEWVCVTKRKNGFIIRKSVYLAIRIIIQPEG